LACFLSAIILLWSAWSQPGKGKVSCFIFSGVALFWIFAYEIMMASLMKSK
jgi:hypothetical protein